MHETIVSKILLATDFSASANLAKVYSEYLAVTLKASVVVLHVSEQRSSTARALGEHEIQTSLRRLEETIGEHAIPVTIQRSTGKPGDQILSTARQLDADLI
jgi:nucleotide-binding universal stress UspA family protein